MNKYKKNNPKSKDNNEKNVQTQINKVYDNGPNKLITNSYNIRVIITPSEYTSENDKNLFREIGPFTGLPFYVFNRMKAKSVINIIKSIVEYERYSRLDYETTEEGAIKAFFGEDESSYKAFKIFDKAVNWNNLSGINIKENIEKDEIESYNENGDIITWKVNFDSSKEPLLKATNEWAIIEKKYLKRINEYLHEFFEDATGWKYQDTIALRDNVALEYIDWICRDCKRK